MQAQSKCIHVCLHKQINLLEKNPHVYPQMEDKGTLIRNAIRAKRLDMQEAADKLEISRSALYNKLNARDIEPEFVQLVEERLGINIHNPERDSSVVAVAERKVGGITMKYHTVPLKAKRVIEMWVPSDFSKADAQSLRNWLAYYESTL